MTDSSSRSDEIPRSDALVPAWPGIRNRPLAHCLETGAPDLCLLLVVTLLGGCGPLRELEGVRTRHTAGVLDDQRGDAPSTGPSGMPMEVDLITTGEVPAGRLRLSSSAGAMVSAEAVESTVDGDSRAIAPPWEADDAGPIGCTDRLGSHPGTSFGPPAERTGPPSGTSQPVPSSSIAIAVAAIDVGMFIRASSSGAGPDERVRDAVAGRTAAGRSFRAAWLAISPPRST
jgi:hypothetical protein